MPGSITRAWIFTGKGDRSPRQLGVLILFVERPDLAILQKCHITGAGRTGIEPVIKAAPHPERRRHKSAVNSSIANPPGTHHDARDRARRSTPLRAATIRARRSRTFAITQKHQNDRHKKRPRWPHQDRQPGGSPARQCDQSMPSVRQTRSTAGLDPEHRQAPEDWPASAARKPPQIE